MDQLATRPADAGAPNSFARKLRSRFPLSAGDLALLNDATADPRRFPARHDLIREGDKPGPAFVVLEGWGCRYKLLPDGTRQITAFLVPGDFCEFHAGELDAMDHSIATLTAARVAAVPRDRMEALLVATPALTRAFWRAQLADEATSRAWIVSMGRRDSLERVAHLMLELHARLRAVGLATNAGCEVPLSQTVLADAVGLTPVHVNRVLRSLRERGALEFGGGALRIPDIAELARIAGFDDNYLHLRLKRGA